MYTVIEQMLKKYHCRTELDYINALKEILQEIALLALWRAKFFEHAAFYGGSALRILYGLDRFSEDLDFTLLRSNKRFSLTPYNHAIENELQSFGLEAEIITKIKNIETNIESAFIKAGTKKQLIVIEAPPEIYKRIYRMRVIKIKVEVDSNPPGKFTTEAKTLLQPIPFTVKTLVKSDLFAGKIHAILCRPWQQRVKGRDWYDFVWYIAQGIPVNLIHLQERLIQSQVWKRNHILERDDLIELLKNKINSTDFAEAKKDVLPFLRDLQSIDLWSTEFFQNLLGRLQFVP